MLRCGCTTRLDPGAYSPKPSAGSLPTLNKLTAGCAIYVLRGGDSHKFAGCFLDPDELRWYQSAVGSGKRPYSQQRFRWSQRPSAEQ